MICCVMLSSHFIPTLSAILAIALALAGFVSCHRVTPTQEPDLKTVAIEDWPLTECSTSTRPVRDLVAFKLLGVLYKWEVD